MKELTLVEKRGVFKELANKSQYQVGVEFGFDKWVDNSLKVVNLVNKVYREVKENPDKFAINNEVVEIVEKGMQSRKHLGPYSSLQATKEPKDIELKNLVLGASKKSWVLLNQKLDYIARNRKAFKNESLLALAKMAGISFDKAQIMKGEATEHISIKAKIDENISSTEALNHLLKIRETQNYEND